MTQYACIMHIENYRDFMDEYTSTFLSTKNSWDSNVLFFTALAVLSFVILITYYIKSEKSFVENIKSGFSLLLLTMVIATASFAIYTSQNNSDLDKIVITNKSITTPFGTCKFTNIKDASFVEIPNDDNIDSTQFLLIQEYTGKAHPISAEIYDVNTILKELKKHLANRVH